MCGGTVMDARSPSPGAIDISDEPGNSGRTLGLRALVDPRVWFVTGGGVGCIPYAPGSLGSIAAAAVWWFGLARLDLVIGGLVIAGVLLIGTWAVHSVQKKHALGDAGAIVIDEFVGCWLALCLVATWPGAIAAVVLFRVFDIAKPGPIGWADRELKGAWGVMVDDIIAGGIAGGLVVAAEWIMRTL